MNIDLVTMAAEHSATMDGIAALMRMMTDPPAGASWASLSNSISAMNKLIIMAAHEADELFVTASAEEEAPETAATETDAKEKTIQENDNTEKPAPSKRQKVTKDMKTEMILMRRDGIPVTKIAEKFGVSTYTVYEYTN